MRSDQRPGNRICVIGTSGCGKTYVAQALAQKLGIPYVCNDAVIWRADWQPTPTAERVAEMDAATAGPAWTFDGNLSQGSPEDGLALERCDTVVWLDLPLRPHRVRIRLTSRRQVNAWLASVAKTPPDIGRVAAPSP